MHNNQHYSTFSPQKNNIPGSNEFTHQSFSGAEVGDDATTSHALEHVLAVPGDEVAVVDDVFFVGLELSELSVSGTG